MKKLEQNKSNTLKKLRTRKQKQPNNVVSRIDQIWREKNIYMLKIMQDKKFSIHSLELPLKH